MDLIKRFHGLLLAISLSSEKGVYECTSEAPMGVDRRSTPDGKKAVRGGKKASVDDVKLPFAFKRKNNKEEANNGR